MTPTRYIAIGTCLLLAACGGNVGEEGATVALPDEDGNIVISVPGYDDLAPAAGAAGAAGSPVSAGGAGGDGGVGGDSTDGGTGNAPPMRPVSEHCGDGILGADEECDDGPGSDSPLCTSSCATLDALAAPRPIDTTTPALEQRRAAGPRTLGDGRHPVAVGDGLAVSYLEVGAGITTHAVGLSGFDHAGVPFAPVAVSEGGNTVMAANPVVAALGGDRYAVAWTDYDGDGDELGVALTAVTRHGFAQ